MKKFVVDYKWVLGLLFPVLMAIGTCAFKDHDRLGKTESAVYWIQYHLGGKAPE